MSLSARHTDPFAVMRSPGDSTMPESERNVDISSRALSADPDEVRWLLNGLVQDPLDNSKRARVMLTVDCVRFRLSKYVNSRERETSENMRMSEYNRVMKDRFAQAALIKELGLEGARARLRELQLHGTFVKDTSSSVMYRFGCMIDRVFEYFEIKGMRMEPFQLELFRGVILGVTENQFGDALFKYKHALLAKMGLAPLGSECYDHVNPSHTHLYHVNKLFKRYANPYTLCLAPRQCGKSMMMRLLLAAVLLHLDINVMIQAQNKHMCTTLRLGVESAMDELQQLPSFRDTEKPVNISGNPENRIYRFDPGYKGTSLAHFLSSSNDVSIHINAIPRCECIVMSLVLCIFFYTSYVPRSTPVLFQAGLSPYG